MLFRLLRIAFDGFDVDGRVPARLLDENAADVHRGGSQDARHLPSERIVAQHTESVDAAAAHCR